MSNILTNNINPRSGNLITIGGANDRVSIAGTLTYEDVSNIDSVGIITAQSGIKVPGGSVAIGLDTTQAPLHVKSSVARASIVESTSTDGSYTSFVDPGTSSYDRVQIGSAGNDLVLRTTELERLRIDSSGRLLIGTSSAQVIGNSQAQIESSTDSSSGYALSLNRSVTDVYGPQINFRSTRGTAASPSTVIANDQLGSIAFYGYDGTDSNHQHASIAANVDGTPGSNDCPGRLVFSTTADGASSPTERLRIDSSGRLGVRTSSPDAELHVGGSEPHIDIGPDSGNRAKIGFKSNDIYIGTSSGSGQTIFKNNVSSTDNPADSGTERLRIDSSGRLLVGTSSSRGVGGNIQSNLQIEGTGTGASTTSCSVFQNSNNATGPRFMLAKSRSTSNGGVTIVQSGDSLGIIDFAGADGTDAGSSAVRISAEVDGTPGSNDMPGRLVFSTTADGASSPTERMKINALGQFFATGAYNATTSNASNVYVFADGLLARSTSSIKYKTGIETIENTYSDALLECRPVWYRSTSSVDNKDWGYWGFIAEEVAEIDPRLVHWKTIEVTYDEKGSAVETPCDPEPEGVAYDRFVPHLLNLIKRQQTAIETLEQRLTDAGL